MTNGLAPNEVAYSGNKGMMIITPSRSTRTTTRIGKMRLKSSLSSGSGITASSVRVSYDYPNQPWGNMVTPAMISNMPIKIARKLLRNLTLSALSRHALDR